MPNKRGYLDPLSFVSQSTGDQGVTNLFRELCRINTLISFGLAIIFFIASTTLWVLSSPLFQDWSLQWMGLQRYLSLDLPLLMMAILFLFQGIVFFYFQNRHVDSETQLDELREELKQTVLSSQYVQTLFEQTDQLVCLLNSDGEALLINDYLKHFTPTSKEESLGKPVWTWNWIQECGVQANLRKALGLSEASRFQAFPPIAADEPVVLEFNVKPIALQGAADKSYFFLSIRSVSEQSYQKASEARLVFEESAAPHLILNEAGGIIACNRSVVEWLCYKNVESLNTKRLFDFSPLIQSDGRNSADKGRQMVSMAFGKGCHQFEWRFETRDGESLNVEVAMVAAFLGTAPCLVVSMQGMDDKKKLESRLLENLDLFRKTMDYTPIGMAIVTLDGRFSQANDALCQFLGYSEEEIRTKTFQDLTHPEDFEIGVINRKRLLNGQIDHYCSEKRYIHQSGRLLWVRMNTFLMRDQKKDPLYFVTHIADFTERRKIATDLDATREALHHANLLKSRFFAKMSHDIRTPMNSVLGMTELALQTDLNHEQREQLEMVFSSAQSLLSVLNDVMDYCKLEAGEFELFPIPFQLRQSLSSLMLLFRQQAQKKGLEFLYEIHPDVPNTLRGDLTRLRQILTNLVGNAIKFSESGEISVVISLQPRLNEGASLLFTIRDTGIGMTPDQQRLIQEHFLKGEQSTYYSGDSGLGLMITSQLIKMMDGSICFQSEYEKGSTFEFTASFLEETVLLSLDNDDARQVAGSLQGLSVLLVDDNIEQLQSLLDIVTSHGIFANTAVSASQAFEKLRHAANQKQPYDVIVSDYGVPEVDGFALARIIKAESTFGNTKIIILSSMGMANDADLCRSIGIHGYLAKPIGSNELMNVIAEVARTEISPESYPVTVFSAETPTHSSSASKSEPSFSEKKYLSILLAEDNEVNQLVALHFLEKAGHHVDLVENGKQAIDAFQDKLRQGEPYDVILMDMHMPDMDGLDATVAIRNLEISNHTASLGKLDPNRVPIIALTANALSGDKAECLAAGMDTYVAKPFKSQELIDAVDQVMKKMAPKR